MCIDLRKGTSFLSQPFLIQSSLQIFKLQRTSRIEGILSPGAVLPTPFFASGLITYVGNRGPGTATLFALTLVELLCGKEKRKEVATPMIFSPGTPC